MEKYKHILLVVFLFVILFLLSFFLYRTYFYLGTPQITAPMAIPDNAALIIKGKKAGNVLELNRERKNFLSILFSVSQQKRINTVLNNIFSKDKYRQLVQSASLYLSIHSTDTDDDLLFALETTKYYNKLLLDFLDTVRVDFKEESFLYKDNRVYALQTDNGLLYVNHQNGLLLMTFSENLMRRTINKLLLKENYLQSVMESFPNKSNENAAIYVYVQYRCFIPSLRHKIQAAGMDVGAINMLTSFQWSVFDLNIKKKDVLLAGYTTLDASLTQSRWMTHKNNKSDVSKLLPVNANSVLSLKADKADDFKNIKSAVQTVEDYFSFMYPVHILTFQIENDVDLYHYLLIKSENISETSFHLYNAISSSFEDNQYILDTLCIGSLLIGHIDLSNFVFVRLGISSHLPQLEYYTVVDDYVVFTNKKEAILFYADELRKNKTLKTSQQYQDMENYFSKAANMFYYCDFSSMKAGNNNNNPYWQSYRENIQTMRMQFHAQSDSILLTNIVFRMQ